MSPFAAVVSRVIDGDTVWVRVRIRTRRSAPPSSTQAGAQAAAALRAELPIGADIWISPIAVDTYGRIIGTIGWPSPAPNT